MSTLTVPMWSKAHPAWGSRRRQQRNAYAFAVTMRMTRGAMVCPTGCGNDLDLDIAEVDKAIPERDYVPGNICYICRGCNQGRGILQSLSPPRDWARVADYIADIASASVGVAIPTEAEARAWWARRPTVTTHPRYARRQAHRCQPLRQGSGRLAGY